jgi:NADH/NAD ratio-sensing transcriptional regulator Rex
MVIVHSAERAKVYSDRILEETVSGMVHFKPDKKHMIVPRNVIVQKQIIVASALLILKTEYKLMWKLIKW